MNSIPGSPDEEAPKALFVDEVLRLHRQWLESGGREGERAELRKAILQEADLHDANLERADLQGAHMSVADLMGANLAAADLRGADLWMADMKDAVLTGADLRGADLTGVTNLTRDQLAGAITDGGTKLPDVLG